MQSRDFSFELITQNDQARLGKIYTKVMFLDPDSYTQYFENLTADWSEMIVRAKKRLAQTSG